MNVAEVNIMDMDCLEMFNADHNGREHDQISHIPLCPLSTVRIYKLQNCVEHTYYTFIRVSTLHRYHKDSQMWQHSLHKYHRARPSAVRWYPNYSFINIALTWPGLSYNLDQNLLLFSG